MEGYIYSKTPVITAYGNIGVSIAYITPRNWVKPHGRCTPDVLEDVKDTLELRMVLTKCGVRSSWELLMSDIKFVVKICDHIFSPYSS